MEAMVEDDWEIVDEEKDEDEANDHQLFAKDTIDTALQSVISHRNQSSGWPFSHVPQPDIRWVLSLYCASSSSSFVFPAPSLGFTILGEIFAFVTAFIIQP